MIQLLCAYAVAAVLAPALFKELGRKAFGMLAIVPAVTAGWAVTQTSKVFAGAYPSQSVPWVPELGLDLVFRLDVLSWLMTLIVSGVGALILIYCWCYFGHNAGHLGRFGGVFVAFAGAMFGLVTSDNTLIVYLFWELTTVFSFLLIGHYHDRQPSRVAAMQAIIVTTFGGLAMLGGLIMLGIVPGGSFSVSQLVESAAAGTLGQGAHPAIVPVAVVLVLLGALTKSAQIPFHFWLPAAMAAPTPVSGYLHAAAMVKAGIYLVARLAPGFADFPGWRPIILVAGLATMIIGGYRALRQHDLKLLLAFGTVSQLGLIMVLVGYGERAVALAGLTMLFAHAMFKASLFLAVGAIDHEYGTRDLRELSGVGRAMPGFTVATTVALASMAGIPPTLGYVGKEAALEAFTHEGQWLILAVIVIGSIFTVGYTLRFWWGAFASKPGVEPAAEHRLDARLGLPIGILAFVGLAAGMAPGFTDGLLAPYARTFEGHDGHLTLWGGFGIPLAATVLVIAGGIVLFVYRNQINKFQAKFTIPAADQVYRKIIHGINNFSADVTAGIQTGSLPNYLAVILLTMVGACGLLIIIGGDVPGLDAPRIWDNPVQAGIVVLACIAAVLVVRSRRRMKAVMLTAFIGYATALLFALQGAPDLALTQALVETVTLVVLVLVLRRLPPYFSNRPYTSDHVRRIVIGAVVGAAVALLGWVAASARIAPPVTVHYPEEVYAFGYGRNIVNVTLVDTRAWDTLGEVSVLLAAATGVASLIFVRERHQSLELRKVLQSAVKAPQVWGRGIPRAAEAELMVSRFTHPPDPNQPSSQRRGRTWLPGAATLAPVRRSLVFEIGARFVFHPLVLFSLYLLFAGHNSPGGGFAGGVLAGIALIIRYLAGGRYELALAIRIRPGALLGLGMAVATTAALVPVLFGGTILQTTVFDFTLPIFHEVHLATALFFDTGVYLIVVGLVLDILSSLGGEIDRQAEAEGSSAPDIAHDATALEVNEEIHVGADLRAALERTAAGIPADAQASEGEVQR
ncbi:MAG: Na+/H+ antiporter subunit A [Propionibacterium sp.]|nr:Na+/H+ antiporter subunit A [Propionibacterium sp.]